jgi:hypothetical protein
MTGAVFQQIIVGMIVGVSAVYLAIRAYRFFFRKEPDCGICSGCPSRSHCVDVTTGKIDESKKQICTHHD